MNIRLAFCMIIALSLSSCGPLVKLTMGIESPDYKEDAQVIKYAEKKLLSNLSIYRIEDFAIDDELLLGVSGLPKLLFVDNNEVKNLGSSCPANVDSWIDADVKALASLPKLRDASQDELSNRLYHCAGSEKLISTEKPTFYIFYGNYLGFINKRKVLPWLQSLENRTDVNYVLVNCDINVPLDPDYKKEKIKFNVNRE